MRIKLAGTRHLRTLCIILLFLMMSGCSVDNTELAATIEMSTPTAQLATIAKTVIPSATTFPIPTATRYPYVSSKTGKQILSEFIQNNGGCELPCLWGITPGISTKSDVQKLKDFFKSGASEVSNENDSVAVESYYVLDQVNPKSVLEVTFMQNRSIVSFSINFIYSRKSTFEQIILESFSSRRVGMKPDEVLTYADDDPYYKEMTKFYSLDRILTLFGAPEKILIQAHPDDAGHPSPPARYPFNFLLYYPDQNSAFMYMAKRESKDSSFSGCPMKAEVKVSVWDPVELTSADDSEKGIIGGNRIIPGLMLYFQPIHAVTDTDIATFYEMFKDGADDCVYTPQDKWPTVE